MKKYLIAIVGVALLASAAALYSMQQPLQSSTTIDATSSTSVSSASTTPTSSDATVVTPANAPMIQVASSSVPAPTQKQSETVTGPSIALSVDGKAYHAPLQTGWNLLDAMRALASTSPDFTFTSRNYPSLGEFIESINGKKGAHSYYWILYVNGQKSGTGVSQTFPKPTDTVQWKFEKGY